MEWRRSGLGFLSTWAIPPWSYRSSWRFSQSHPVFSRKTNKPGMSRETPPLALGQCQPSVTLVSLPWCQVENVQLAAPRPRRMPDTFSLSSVIHNKMTEERRATRAKPAYETEQRATVQHGFGELSGIPGGDPEKRGGIDGHPCEHDRSWSHDRRRDKIHSIGSVPRSQTSPTDSAATFESDLKRLQSDTLGLAMRPIIS